VIEAVGERAVRVVVAARDGLPAHQVCRGATARLREAALAGAFGVGCSVWGTREVVVVEARELPPVGFVGAVRARVMTEEAGMGAGGAVVEAAREVVLPMVVDAACAPDLAALAEGAGCSVEAVVRGFCGAEFTVAFLGFAPGFAYLDGLPARLAVPRLATPRARVPAGSVGIGGSQAGVYPLATPGGWRIIGRTPRRVFDAGRVEPALLRPGDRVRFEVVPSGSVTFDEVVPPWRA
jgi:KipI family sensor histidine kinase inhibitor